jgi:ATP-dependent exoDNAse (exonuclease V) beta subunit
MERLKKLVWRSHDLSAASLFSVILEELEIFKYTGAKDLEYAYYALELLRSAEAAGQFSSLPQAAAYLEMLTSDASDAERAISLTRNENRVHIANLHKVKGLEAPVVILADPYSKSNAPDVRVEQQDSKPLCWIFSVRKGYSNLLSCSGYEDAKDAETACLEAEKKRLLYVAATRAQRVLIVADAITSKGESDEKNPWKFFVDRCDGDFFQVLPVGEVAPVAKKPEVSAAELYDSATNLLQTTTSGKQSFSILRPSQIKLKGKTSSEDDFEDVQEADVRTHTVRANAAVIGTLVHSLMEALVSSRNTAPLSTLVQEIASEYEAESEAYTQLLAKVGATMQSGGFPQENEAPQDILPVLLAADEVYCEVPFCRKNGSELWHGIMDVVYRIGEQWFILDYKTNADAHDLDTKYQAQLSAYVEAFHDLTGHTATPLIYHIDV